jgi:hypothetical protein
MSVHEYTKASGVNLFQLHDQCVLLDPALTLLKDEGSDATPRCVARYPKPGTTDVLQIEATPDLDAGETTDLDTACNAHTPVAETSGGLGFGDYWFWAPQLCAPNGGAPVSTIAELAVDSDDSDLIVRLMGDTTDSGAIAEVRIPSKTRRVRLTLVVHATTGVLDKEAHFNAHGVTVKTGAAIPAWSAAKAMTEFVFAANKFHIEQSDTFDLAALGLTPGRSCLIQVSRDADHASDNLVGNVEWVALGIELF